MQTLRVTGRCPQGFVYLVRRVVLYSCTKPLSEKKPDKTFDGQSAFTQILPESSVSECICLLFHIIILYGCEFVLYHSMLEYGLFSVPSPTKQEQGHVSWEITAHAWKKRLQWKELSPLSTYLRVSHTLAWNRWWEVGHLSQNQLKDFGAALDSAAAWGILRNDLLRLFSDIRRALAATSERFSFLLFYVQCETTAIHILGIKRFTYLLLPLLCLCNMEPPVYYWTSIPSMTAPLSAGPAALSCDESRSGDWWAVLEM